MSRRMVTLLAGLAVLAMGVTSTAAQTGQVVEYYHLDALGSVRAVTDQAGQVIARHDFLPFGEEWNPPANAKEKKFFTGHERDAETGLDYFGARYYRPQVGRFTTVDPLQTTAENLVDPQRWNRYAYVRNNPLRWVDPDGRWALEPWEAEGHTDLTRKAVVGTKLTREDQAALIEADLQVDRLSNQSNDAAHYEQRRSARPGGSQ